MASQMRNALGGVEAGTASASYTDTDGAYMDYDSGLGYAQFGAKKTSAGSLGVKIRTILAGVAVAALTFSADGIASFLENASFGSSARASTIAVGLNAAAGQTRQFYINTAGLTRWTWGGTNSAESGSNAGSNFFITAYTDAGAAIDTPLSITRAAGGTMTIARPLTVTGTAFTLTPGAVEYNATFGSNTSTSGTIAMNSAAGGFRDIKWVTASANRWIMRVTSTAEAGSDAGSNWQLNAYNDAGVFIDTVIGITRAAGGAVTVSRPLTVTGLLNAQNSTGAIFGTAAMASQEIVALRAAAGQLRDLAWQSGTTNRWIARADSTAEGGSDAGSTWQLNAYNDAGTFIDSAISIVRAAQGLIQFGRSTTVTSGTLTTNKPGIDITQTWNAGGVTFNGLRVAITNTASAAASSLIEATYGGVSYFSVSPGTAPGRTNVRRQLFITDGTDTGYIEVNTVTRIQSVTSQSLVFGSAAVDRWNIISTGHLKPVGDNTYELGGSGAMMKRTWTYTRVMKGATVTYSASMTPDASLGERQIITATNGTAFTINAPSNPTTDQPMIITIRNTSGGALGAATWNPVFKMAAWTNPANGFSRSITFWYDGTNWIEMGRTTADIPN